MPRKLVKNISVNPSLEEKGKFNLIIIFWTQPNFIKSNITFEEALNQMEVQLRKARYGKTDDALNKFKSWKEEKYDKQNK